MKWPDSFCLRAKRTCALFAGVSLILPLDTLRALPAGMQVSSGQLVASGSGNVLQLDQLSPQAIANWESFSIGAGQQVNILQLGADSVLLNRVLGANPSELLGQLNANGRVFLVNPNGIVVGRDASVNTAEFMASALNISDADFLNGGDMLFEGDSTAGVLNLGKISASNGDVILIGHKVVNSGELSAPEGMVALGAGNEVLLTPEGSQRIMVKKNLAYASDGTGVENSGLIEAAQAELKAAGGNIYEMAVNQSGIVRATGIERRDGRVLLTASGGRLLVSGEVAAQNADGSGGDVRIGGGFQGADATIENAEVAFVSDTAAINVSATAANADAGTAVVWADGATYFGGFIDGRGGALGGDGAEVEVSGFRQLDYRGLADLSAPAGEAGSLLLDPVLLEIVASGTESDPITLGDAFTFGNTDTATTSTLLVSTLETQLGLGNVELLTIDTDTGNGGSITVSDSIAWTSGNRLTFSSGDSIYINASIDAGAGDITFGLGPESDDGGFSPTILSELVVASGASLTADSILIGTSMPGGPFGPLGRIEVNGPLDVNRLMLNYPIDALSQYGGVLGTTTIDNPSNRIDVLEGSTSPGLFQGDLTVVDSEGGLTLEGDFFAGLGADINISTTGDLTVASGAKITTGALFGGTEELAPFSDIHLAAKGGAFINQAGADSVDAFGTGRFLIYSATPTTINKGGLIGAPVYNKTFDTNAPASITQTGDRFLYELAPVLTFTVNDASRDYGDANPAFSFAVSGLIAGDTAGDVYSGSPTVSTALTPTTSAGFYEDAITLTQAGLTLSDYDYGFAADFGNLTIDKVALSITPNAATRIYGDPDPEFSGTIVGLKNGETAADLTTAPTYTPSSTIASPVGSYNLFASGAASPNYTFNYQPGTNLFSITQAPLMIRANPASRLYGAADPAFSAAFSGLKNNEAPGDISGLSFTTPDSTVASDVGTGYIIRPGGASNANYAISYEDGTLSINPAPLTIQANNESIDLGDSIPDPSSYTATFTGLVAGEVEADYLGSLLFANEALDSGTAGSFDITPFGVTDSNYAITFNAGILSIGAGLLTITANDASRVYGAANPDFSASFSGFVNGDDKNVLTSPVTFSTTATFNSPVTSTYPIVPGGATADNYSISFLPGTLTLTPASLLIRGNDASRLYGAGNPSFGASFTGLVADDTEADITGLNFSTDAVTTSPVGGSYYIRPANASNPNYSFSYEVGSLTINRAPLQITANDATREYGAADPGFSASYSGFVAGDTETVVSGLTFGTNATVGSSVGTNYVISPSGATSLNYTLSYVDGKLSITPADLQIRAEDASRAYGDANPDFSASFVGLRAGDLESDFNTLTFATAAANATVGIYPLTVSGAINSNYTISYLPGEFEVLARALQITGPSFSLIYGDAIPELEPKITGLASFDSVSVLGPVAVSAPGLSQFSDADTYATNASGATNPNYDVSYVPGTVVVNPRDATIRANDTSRLYGDANPLFFASSSGFFASDFNLAWITYTTPAEIGSGVGTYAITPISYRDTNYNVSFEDGELTVTPAPLTVSLGTASRVYGELNPDLNFTATGLKLSDTDAVVSLDGLTTDLGPGTSVGDYAATYGNAAADNYDLTVEPGTISITPRPIKIVASDAERFYGDANPAFEIANADTNLLPAIDPVNQVVRLSTSATQSSFADAYAITPELLSSNYELTATPGTLTVNPRPLNIVIDDIELIYGDSRPTFTYGFAGLGLPDGVTSLGSQIEVGGDLVRIYSLINGRGPSAGFYEIDVTSSEFLNPRAYELVSVETGTLKIAPKPVTLALNSFDVELPAGTDLSTVDPTQLGLPFGAQLFGLLEEDTIENVLPDLSYRIYDVGPITLDVVSFDYADAFYASADGFDPLPTTPVTVSPPSVTGNGLVVIGSQRIDGIAPADASSYLVFGSRNYAVTEVIPGNLVLNRPLTLSNNPELEAIIAQQQATPPIKIISERDYRNNFGIFLENNSDLGVNLINDFIAKFLGDSDQSHIARALLTAIAGESAESAEDMTPAMILAWMSGVSSDPIKRQMLSGVLADYAMNLQSKDPSTYTPADQHFVSALNAEMRDQRTDMIDAVAAKREAYFAEKNAHGGTELQDVFGDDIPYDEFITEYMIESIEQVAADIAIAAGVSAGGIGAASAASAAVGMGAGAIAKTVIPFAAGGASKTAMVGLKVALGPFAAFVVVLEVSIIRGFQIAKNEKARSQFEDLMDPSTGSTNLGNMSLDPEDESMDATLDRLVLFNALNNMLGG